MDASGYVSAKALPLALLENVIIYCDEGLWSNCLHLLRSLAVGTYNGDYTNYSGGSALVPNAHILALLATLTVHPSMTTRASSPEDELSAEDALDLLIHINKLIGPRNANLGQAFLYTSQAGVGGSRRLNKRQRIRDDANTDGHTAEDSSSDDKESFVNDEKALDGSLFTKSEDFWHMFGWAMNCATKHPKRWAVWQPWLEFHLTVLEDDWKARFQQWLSPNTDLDNEQMPLADSLIMQYLKGASSRDGRNAQRRIFRAIFAHGEKGESQEFHEIFKNELKERKAPQDKIGKRKRVDLDQDEWGDYYDNEDDDDETFQVKIEDGTKRRVSARRWNDALDQSIVTDEDTVDPDRDPIERWGGCNALALRQRILVLLSEVSEYQPFAFVPMYDLLGTYAEFLRPLPSAIFIYLLRPSPSLEIRLDEGNRSKTVLGRYYHPITYLYLAQTILEPLTATGGVIRKSKMKSLVPDFIDLRNRLLTLTATSKAARENAMVSYLLEGILRTLLPGSTKLAPSSPNESSQDVEFPLLPAGEGLRDEIHFGVGLRESKTLVKKNAREAEATLWLEASKSVLELIADMIESGDTQRFKDHRVNVATGYNSDPLSTDVEDWFTPPENRPSSMKVEVT